MSKRGRCGSPVLTLGHAYPYKRVKTVGNATEYGGQSPDMTPKQIAAVLLARIEKVEAELRISEQKVRTLEAAAHALQQSNAKYQQDFFELYHYLGIPIRLYPQHPSYIT